MSVERKGDPELVVAQTFNAPAGTAYRVWSQPELFQRMPDADFGTHHAEAATVSTNTIVRFERG